MGHIGQHGAIYGSHNVNRGIYKGHLGHIGPNDMGHTGHMLVILCGSGMAQVGHLWVNHGIFGSHRPFHIGQPSVIYGSCGSYMVLYGPIWNNGVSE